jgi:hypothetical protein
MFSKDEVEAILNELRQQWGGDEAESHADEPHAPLSMSDWEKLLRHAYLGMARADAGVALGDLDPRVIAVIEKYQKQAAQKA